MNYWGNFLSDISKLLTDLFRIWEYPTFSLLLCMFGVYLTVKIVQYMFRML